MRLILLVFAFIMCIAQTASAQLIISAVFDGPLTGGTPKGVELYAYQDIPDLSIYGLGTAFNGGASNGQDIALPAIALTQGTYFYAASESVGFNAFFGFAPDLESSEFNINGDDIVELFKNGTAVDVFGVVGVDGTGQPWEYLDGWAARKDHVNPTTTFDPANWTFSGVNALDNETTNATAATPVPIMMTLPVALTNLTAHPLSKTTMVKWTTAQESGNDFFAVERSLDGRAFAEIGRVRGAGNSAAATSYEFTDEAPVAGTTYYRLRQVDFSGAQAVFGPVPVVRTGEGISAFPNPASDFIAVRGAAAGAQLTILDLNGRVISQSANTGNDVDVSNLRPGTYLVRISDANTVETLRFVRQ